MATARRRVSRPKAKAAGRRDPKPRHVNGARPWGVVKNKDPDYDYHFWAETDTAHGLAEMQAQGWDPIERQDPDKAPDAEQLQGGTTARHGEWIRSRGLVLCRRAKNHPEAEFDASRRETFVENISRDLGLAGGTAQARWNRRNIMGEDLPPLDPSIREEVTRRSSRFEEANPYPSVSEAGLEE